MKSLTSLKLAMLGACAFAAFSQAEALTINDAGVVGIVKGLAGDNPGSDEPIFAQHLLTMLKSSTDSFGSPLHDYQTSDTEYTGTIVPGSTVKIDSSTNVAAGYDFVIAKYDGQNGGYVLFYLGGAATVLPSFPNPIWGGPNQYGISDYTAFKATSVHIGTTDVGGVPDSGSTLMLLGMAFSGLGIARRFCGSKAKA